jgi:hypothetical protein
MPDSIPNPNCRADQLRVKALAHLAGSVIACAKSRQHCGQILRANVEMLTYPAPQHRGGHIPIAALLLRLIEDVQHHTLLASQTVSYIRYCVEAFSHIKKVSLIRNAVLLIRGLHGITYTDGMDPPHFLSSVEGRRKMRSIALSTPSEERQMNKTTTLAIDLAKQVFQLHGADFRGKATMRQKVRRSQLPALLAQTPPCSVVMEACSSAHYWAREARSHGHKIS